MSAFVVVCGLAAEAKVARGSDDLTIIAGGGDAERIARDLDRHHPSAVLSFGIAGGLAPRIEPGDVRIADAIILPGGRRLPADEDWASAMASALDAPIADLAGVDAPLADADAKLALHRASGAALVDMESHVAAMWAERHGARFAALRVAADPAGRSLPHAATVGMRPDGGADLPAILRSLAKNPGQLTGLIRVGLDARAAFATLLRCRQRLGPRFALLDLG